MVAPHQMCSKLTPQMAPLATKLLAGEFLQVEIYRHATLLLGKHVRTRVIAFHIPGLAQLLFLVRPLTIHSSLHLKSRNNLNHFEPTGQNHQNVIEVIRHAFRVEQLMAQKPNLTDHCQKGSKLLTQI